ncbi:hypothetical protein JJB27_03755 [Campylobacter fetus subsp. venerealis]|uniref:hypothetical protein n=1 Tax=Campylobacter fetus TaxID=196 RepID=UPI0008189BB8|nr:hypothetical protein [Campylobacter fetus]MBK3498192.1 hypothetical protein [Campylobacter fetus subsp. venerealis]MBK3502177.1 hypothetical protein [Campylobacter fetus subsp. venerealis]OCS16826.1 hypothetical protein CfvWBT01109_01965 [Campylobacter fetus subsp. venerealis]
MSEQLSPKQQREKIGEILYQKEYYKDVDSYEKLANKPSWDYDKLISGLEIAYSYDKDSLDKAKNEFRIDGHTTDEDYIRINTKLYEKLEKELKTMNKEAEIYKDAKETENNDYNNFCRLYIEIHEKDVQLQKNTRRDSSWN